MFLMSGDTLRNSDIAIEAYPPFNGVIWVHQFVAINSLIHDRYSRKVISSPTLSEVQSHVEICPVVISKCNDQTHHTAHPNGDRKKDSQTSAVTDCGEETHQHVKHLSRDKMISDQ